MSLDYPTIIRMASQVIWPMGRIGGLLLTLPVFSSTLVPPRIKVILLLILSYVCSFMVPKELSFLDFNGYFLVYIIQELLFGLLMGFVVQLVFQIFILGGQIIAMQAGLSFAVMMDPGTKASVPLVSQFYSMMMTLLFLSLNGHLIVLEALMDSFRIMPVGQLSVASSTVWSVILFSGWMFQQALLISIPALLSLLIVSLSFGIMARAAPQLNIFSLGFPITLMMGIVVLKVGLSSVAAQMADRIADGIRFITGILH